MVVKPGALEYYEELKYEWACIQYLVVEGQVCTRFRLSERYTSFRDEKFGSNGKTIKVFGQFGSKSGPGILVKKYVKEVELKGIGSIKNIRATELVQMNKRVEEILIEMIEIKISSI